MPSIKTDNDSNNNCSLRKNTGHLDKIEKGEKSRSPKHVIFTVFPMPHNLFSCANGGNTAKNEQYYLMFILYTVLVISLLDDH